MHHLALITILSSSLMGQAGPGALDPADIDWGGLGQYGSYGQFRTSPATPKRNQPYSAPAYSPPAYSPPAYKAPPKPLVAPPRLGPAIPLPPLQPQRPPQATKPIVKKFYGSGGIRQDLAHLPPDSPTLKAYRKAIEVMRRLPPDDPHSLVFQGNIHGFPPDTLNPDPTWGQCQHGNWWFFPWHRAYLHFFERIVRHYGEDPSFCLPYWDYSNPQARTLPLAFRDPASPLYNSTRREQVNDGTDQLDAAVVVAGANASMANTLFSDFGSMVTFGGQALNAPVHLATPHGALESMPHDMIHRFIGGNMGNPDLAARDPVFFVHHANIDRLWVEWLQMGQGRANPSNEVWLNQKFIFYDENKKLVAISIREVLDISALGYSYEKSGTPSTTVTRNIGYTNAETLVQAKTSDQPLENEPVHVSLVLPDESLAKLQKNLVTSKNALAQIPSQVQLRLEGVRFNGQPDSCVAVYLNLPKGVEKPDPRSPYYAGCFTFFGHPNHHGEFTSYLDVTKHLQKMWPFPDRDSKEISVTLVRISCGTLPEEFRTPCTCSQLSLATCK